MPRPRAALERKLTSIRDECREFISRAADVAKRISHQFERLVSEKKLAQDDLFDNDYVAIEGTDPTQYRTQFLAALEHVLPPIQEPLLDADPRMVFCVAVDRNGYLPVHNRKYSLPQRPGETAWNIANARTRRIFDDRAGLAAARNVRPYIIQVYAREMGNGVTVMMREVDAPIRSLRQALGRLPRARTSMSLANAQPILQRNVEAQRLRQQALAEIEPVREKIIEPGIEHELVAAERTAVLLQLVQKLRAMAAAALGLIRDQIVDIEEFAVDQISR